MSDNVEVTRPKSGTKKEKCSQKMYIFFAKNLNLKTVSTNQNEEFTDRKKAELTKAFQANDQDTFLMIFQIAPQKIILSQN